MAGRRAALTPVKGGPVALPERRIHHLTDRLAPPPSPSPFSWRVIIIITITEKIIEMIENKIKSQYC